MVLILEIRNKKTGTICWWYSLINGWSEDSIGSTLSLVNQNSKFSGLKPNFMHDKTQCIKIGSTVHTGSKLCKKYKNKKT